MILNKKSKARRHHNSGLQGILQSCSHQDIMVLAQKQTHRSIEQNRKTRNELTTIWPTNLQQSGKEYPMEKRQSLQQMVLKNWTATCRRMKLDHFLTPYTKINSKWMTDLHVRQETRKILQEHTGSNLLELGCSNFLLDTSPEAREIKAKMNYWDLIKIKSSVQ